MNETESLERSGHRRVLLSRFEGTRAALSEKFEASIGNLASLRLDEACHVPLVKSTLAFCHPCDRITGQRPSAKNATVAWMSTSCEANPASR